MQSDVAVNIVWGVINLSLGLPKAKRHQIFKLKIVDACICIIIIFIGKYDSCMENCLCVDSMKLNSANLVMGRLLGIGQII